MNILLVEDELLWQEAIETLLSTLNMGTIVAKASSFDEAMAAFERVGSSGIDGVLLDWNIEGPSDGLAVGQALEAKGIPAHRIILTSGSDPQDIPENPYVLIPKPKLTRELGLHLAQWKADMANAG